MVGYTTRRKRDRIVDLYFEGKIEKYIDFCKFIGKIKTQNELSESDIDKLNYYINLNKYFPGFTPPYPERTYKDGIRKNGRRHIYMTYTILDLKGFCFINKWSRGVVEREGFNIVIRSYNQAQVFIKHLKE